MAKRANWRKVKKHRNYQVSEIAKTLPVAKGTVLRWIREGLPTVEAARPYLILGGDLIEFLKQRKPPKQKCALDECYCFKCKSPRRPAFEEMEYHPSNAKSGNLRALCASCATVMHKRTSAKKVEQLSALVHVAIIPKPVIDYDDPSAK